MAVRDQGRERRLDISNGFQLRKGWFVKTPGAQRASGMHSIGSCLYMKLFHRPGFGVGVSGVETVAYRCYNRHKSSCDGAVQLAAIRGKVPGRRTATVATVCRAVCIHARCQIYHDETRDTGATNAVCAHMRCHASTNFSLRSRQKPHHRGTTLC